MRRTTLHQLAEKAGLKIIDEGFRVIYIRKGTPSWSVAVYSDGTAHRTDVDLSITKNMTIIACAKHLELV